MGRLSKKDLLARMGDEIGTKLGEGFKVYPEERGAVVEYSPDNIRHCNVRVKYDRPDFRGFLPIELHQLVIDKATARYQELLNDDGASADQVHLANEAYLKIKRLASVKVKATAPRPIGKAGQPEPAGIPRELGMQMLEAIQELTLEVQALTETLAKPKRYEVRQYIETPTPKENEQ